MRDTDKNITIIIPAYNEEEGISNVLDEMRRLSDDYEIIIVDDGSTDNTADIIKKHPNIKLIQHENNMGYGASLKTGIKNATGDAIFITDADRTYPNDKISDLIKLYHDSKADMIVGSRTGLKVEIPLIRKPAKWVINKLANYLCGVNIPDLNSGFRLMNKNVVEKFLNILPDGFSFTTTITLAMLSKGYSVKYTPINYAKRAGKSKIRPIKDTLNFIQLIIRTVMYFNPLKIFVPLSLSLVLLACFILIASWLLLGKIMDVTFGVILMTAVMVMAVGMLADLIDKRMP